MANDCNQGGIPLGGIPLGGIPLGGIPLGGIPLSGIPLNRPRIFTTAPQFPVSLSP